MIRWLKIVGAVLLLACLVLPMSSCTEHRDADGKIAMAHADGTYSADVHEVKVRHYLIDRVNRIEPLSWLNIVAVIWPAVFVGFAFYRPQSRLCKIMWFTEPLLLAGSFYMLYMGSLLEEFEIGTYVGWFGIASYLLGWLMEATQRGRARLQRRKDLNSTPV